MPLLIKWPGVIEPGTDTDVVVSGADFFSTFRDILGEENPSLTHDGSSLLPLLQNVQHDLKERPVFWYEPVYLDSYDSARYVRDKAADRMQVTPYGRLEQTSEIESLPGHEYPAWRLVPAAAVRMRDYKMIYYIDYDRFELYNLQEDPGEQYNLIDKKPELTAKMKAVLMDWAKRSRAKLELEPNPDFDKASITNYKN